MSIELPIPANTFDRDAHFAFEYLNYKKQPSRGEGYVFHDDVADEWFILQTASCLKDSYTAEDRAHLDRIFRGEQVLRTGDSVTVNGKAFTVKILGDYSDAGRLIPA